MVTRLSKGELSPLLEGSPDLEAYFEGCSILEGFQVMRQGGIRRWPGTRFIKEVKDSSKDVILLPFEFSVDDAYILEVGDLYIRIYKNKAPVLNVGVHVEVTTGFVVGDIREIHFTQSADVLFLFHDQYQQQKLSRVSDTSWSLTLQAASPPPSFEADTDLSATMALGANTGSAIPFRVGTGVLLAGDANRQIISGAGRAVITSIVDSFSGVADILDPFSQTITAGPAVASTVGTAWTSVAHGLIAGDYVRLTSGPQSGELRRIAVSTPPDSGTLDAAFSANQTNQTWNKISATASGAWFLRLSPWATLDPTIKEPVGAQVTLACSLSAFRSADIGKYINIYGGVVRVTHVDTAASIRGTIESVMGDATAADPPAAAAGAWTLEVASWSATRGYPRTGEFFQGRLYTAATESQPTTFWGSRSDDYDNNAIGIAADDAVEYTMAAKKLNRIEWLTEHNKSLLVGTSGAEHKVVGSGSDNQLIGGDTIPLTELVASNGCAPIQPIHARRSTLYIDRSRKKVLMIGFDLDSDGETDKELSVGAEHITGAGVKLGPLAFQRRPDPRLLFEREDGQMVGMTFFPEQKVVAFYRRVTQGTFESCAVIPQASGLPDQVWCIAKRTISGVTKRYVEIFEENHETLTRSWKSLQTDCALVLTGLTGTTVTGLIHLAGATVEVVKNSSAIGTHVVSGTGTMTVTDALVASDVLEIGLPYTSTATTMRPAIPGQVIDGLPRSWDALRVRVKDTLGGTMNGARLQYPQAVLDTNTPYTGDIKVTGTGWDEEGRLTLEQDKPYPMTALAMFGTLSIGDHD